MNKHTVSDPRKIAEVLVRVVCENHFCTGYPGDAATIVEKTVLKVAQFDLRLRI